MTIRSPGLLVDEAFELLASEHRRHFLSCLLRDTEAPIHLSDLTDQLADEMNSNVQPVGSQHTHNHLPQLADAGVIAYDIGRGIVSPTEAASDLEPLLDSISEWESGEG